MTDAVGHLAHLPSGSGLKPSRPRAPTEPAPWLALDSRWLWIGAPAALVVWLSLVPLVFLIWQSFLTPQTATMPARFTLDNFRTAYFSSETVRLFLNSVEFAVGAAALSLALEQQAETMCPSEFQSVIESIEAAFLRSCQDIDEQPPAAS